MPKKKKRKKKKGRIFTPSLYAAWLFLYPAVSVFFFALAVFVVLYALNHFFGPFV